MSEKKRNFLKFIKSGTYTDKSGNRTNTDKAAAAVKKIDLDLETMKPASTKKMKHGGEAVVRGMGAAIKGGKFEGVF
tara:strand:+ start:239 stop:469 length:231 start_codon:yes stop_codon:yes gene_type:complete